MEILVVINNKYIFKKFSFNKPAKYKSDTHLQNILTGLENIVISTQASICIK